MIANVCMMYVCINTKLQGCPALQIKSWPLLSSPQIDAVGDMASQWTVASYSVFIFLRGGCYLGLIQLVEVVLRHSAKTLQLMINIHRSLERCWILITPEGGMHKRNRLNKETDLFKKIAVVESTRFLYHTYLSSICFELSKTLCKRLCTRDTEDGSCSARFLNAVHWISIDLKLWIKCIVFYLIYQWI